MANRRPTCAEVNAIVSLKQRGRSERSIAYDLGLSRRTVRRYAAKTVDSSGEARAPAISELIDGVRSRRPTTSHLLPSGPGLARSRTKETKAPTWLGFGALAGRLAIELGDLHAKLALPEYLLVSDARGTLAAYLHVASVHYAFPPRDIDVFIRAAYGQDAKEIARVRRRSIASVWNAQRRIARRVYERERVARSDRAEHRSFGNLVRLLLLAVTVDDGAPERANRIDNCHSESSSGLS